MCRYADVKNVAATLPFQFYFYLFGKYFNFTKRLISFQILFCFVEIFMKDTVIGVF